MKTYRINYGPAPYNAKVLGSWEECAKAIKKMLDEGIPVHGVLVEYEYNEEIE